MGACNAPISESSAFSQLDAYDVYKADRVTWTEGIMWFNIHV